ncbi:uncharacterized protein L201_001010 [Kwoniella dendrophila CBS 6074]|uniref:Myb-like domain-containing protein n=1 Tax=Kwoniella dendrophila CBS 6074 TaxID=1295534 RepID=A0AAX4JMP2_9TREE
MLLVTNPKDAFEGIIVPTSQPSSSLSITPKKPKGNTRNATPKKSPGKSSPSNSSSWTNEKKSIFIKRLVETGYKNMDWKSLSSETEMTEDQCKNQMTPGRPGNSNLGKAILEMFR